MYDCFISSTPSKKNFELITAYFERLLCIRILTMYCQNNQRIFNIYREICNRLYQVGWNSVMHRIIGLFQRRAIANRH
jgi:hypothetical protein